MRKLKRDDLVLVTTGKERGKQGQIREVFTSRQRVIIQGLNMVKRHQRQKDERTPAGIIEKEAPIHISNLKLICRACQKPVRVGFRVRSDNVKVRVCRSCGEDID
ncbi:MAG: 50S ribosomal protein L24 [Chloroflexi bacterium]|nr:50S ribosomal protein L24 [Chloroflexota bacterium]MCH8900983.1 50S ribosomal protein L24 [Chloroflexota bacterium]